MTIADNIVYNWVSGNPTQRSPAFRVGHRTTPLDSSFVVRNNVFAQPTGGPVLQTTATPPGGTWSGNTYHTIGSNQVLIINDFVPIAQWVSAAGEIGARNELPNFADPTRDVSSYMQHIGVGGGLEEFLAQARLQSRSNWRSEFTAQAVNAYIREGFGRPAAPGSVSAAGQ
jgi:hypothetical protein